MNKIEFLTVKITLEKLLTSAFGSACTIQTICVSCPSTVNTIDRSSFTSGGSKIMKILNFNFNKLYIHNISLLMVKKSL